MENSKKQSNSLVVKNSKPKKIVFKDKNKYENAVHNEEKIIHQSDVRIHDLEEKLKKLKALEKEINAKSKKPAAKKKTTTKKKSSGAKKSSSANQVNANYEKLYALELETLRVAFEVLPEKTRKEYNKRIYKMIDRLIEKKFIEKLH